MQTPYGNRFSYEHPSPERGCVFPAGEIDEFCRIQTATANGIQWDLIWETPPLMEEAALVIDGVIVNTKSARAYLKPGRSPPDDWGDAFWQGLLHKWHNTFYELDV